jgi:hypothetical protein
MTTEEKRIIDDLLEALYAEPDHHDPDYHNNCRVCRAMEKVQDLLGYKYEWLTADAEADAE